MIVEECVHAYSSGYTSLACDSTWHTLGMVSEFVDSGGFHDNATNNSRITFPSGGIFLVFGAPQWVDPGFVVYSQLTKNGTSVGYAYGTDGFTALPTQLSGATPFWLESFSAGDYIETQTWNNRDAAGGGTNFRDARMQMCALKVSEWSCHVAGSGASSASPQTFDTTVFDPNGMVTSSTTLTAQVAGYYLVLTIFDGNTGSNIRRNGSILNGSYAEGAGACDYAVGWFNAGDTVTMTSPGTMYSRQMAMVYLGDENVALAYTYDDNDISNTDAGYSTFSKIRTDTEWIDTGHGHPQNGYQYNISPAYCITCGDFAMLEGYHFGLAKISTDGGTFLQNDAAYLVYDGSVIGNVVSNNRHSRGSHNTTLAFGCFQATYGKTFIGAWWSSAIYQENLYTFGTNVFVTDAGQWTPQIYRRLGVPA